MPSPNQELESYKDAVWDFILEHCDITERGSYFVKFHASDRRNFENRIKARWKYGYHRKDDRLNFSHQQKEKLATSLKQAHESRKIAKHRQYVLGREERMMIRQNLIEHIQKDALLAKSPTLYAVIHKRVMQPLAHQWYNVRQLWKNRLQKIKSNSNASTVILPQSQKQD